MMATRLTDSELAQRVRAGNRVRAQRQQERRRTAGLVQLNVWLPHSTRTALDRAAAHRNMTVSETVSDLLERALSAAMLLNATTTRDKPISAYHCWQCDARMTVEREREPLCEACEAASQAATTTPDTPAASNDTTTSGKDELMTWIGERLNEGLTGNEIARQLNASGQRTASGAAFTGQNILRDYRAWVKKTGTVSTSCSGDTDSHDTTSA